MIRITATAESFEQANELIDAGVDRLYVGGHPFGLRLPKALDLNEIAKIISCAHARHRKVIVAVNALMHNNLIEQLPEYLKRLAGAGADAITVGDPGAILTLQELDLPLPYLYDGETLVTSAGQIDFWIQHGAAGAIAARELTLTELIRIQAALDKPIEVLVYGPTCIHQSKRPLLSNYYRYAHIDDRTDKDRGLYLRDPKNAGSRYPIFEDGDGTHVFSTEDLSFMSRLHDLYDHGLHCWKLDGVLMQGQTFVRIAALFVEAKRALEAGTFEPVSFSNRLRQLQPPERQIGTGFYLKRPEDVK